MADQGDLDVEKMRKMSKVRRSGNTLISGGCSAVIRGQGRGKLEGVICYPCVRRVGWVATAGLSTSKHRDESSSM